MDRKHQQKLPVVQFKKREKEAKKLAGTEINNKSIETRHQRNNITTKNAKKQSVNIQNRP